VFTLIFAVAIVFLSFKGFFIRFDPQKIIAGIIKTPVSTPNKEEQPITIPIPDARIPDQSTDSSKVASRQAVSETTKSASVKSDHPVTPSAHDAGRANPAADSLKASSFEAVSETPKLASVKVDHPTTPSTHGDRPSERAKNFSKASSFPAGSEPSRSSSLDLAYKALEEKKFHQAIAFFEENMTYRPEQLSTFKMQYVQALLGQAGSVFDKNPIEAEILLSKAAEIDPQNANAHIELGKLYTRMSDYRNAIDAYQRAVELNRQSADIYFNLGYLHAKIKNYGRAETMLRRVVELKPSYIDKAIFNLAMVQLEQGKKRESAVNLEKALTINPENQKARKYLERLNDSQGKPR
jgi:Tfp pilus assembly protein PilF